VKLGVIGKTGQLGKALAARAPNATFWGRENLDLSEDLGRQRDIIKNFPQVDVVILAAAYTDVDRAETEEKEGIHTCFTVNGPASFTIAHALSERGIEVIYISSDYIFDGKTTRPYRVTDQTNPLNAYGHSKRASEENLRKHSVASVMRTSWLFDGTSKNFLTTMLSLKDKDELPIVDDQIGRPTYAGHLADAVLELAEGLHQDPKGNCGIYHASANGAPVSWHDFAAQIFSSIGGGPNLIPVTTEDYGAPAPRPKYSVLDNSAFEKRFDHVMPDWTDGLRAALKEAGYDT